MSTRQAERPEYFEGQYLGEADLSAAVDYSRYLSRSHALAGHAWGIAMGLGLIERVDEATGEVNYYIEPGFAWDGYGRPIALFSPVQVPASLFAQLPPGNHNVWLRYNETPFRGLRPGFGTCSEKDSFSRIQEGFAIEVGPKPSIKDRQSGITLGGAAVQDARNALQAVDENAPIVCDASVPHQTYPEDIARWLIPVGIAAWTGMVFAERSDATKLQNRLARHYAGLVGESVLAADGILRLRDRMTSPETGVGTDALCAKDAIKDTDLEIDPSGRLVGKELVWVEGNLRAEGHVRLFGTRLEWRDETGNEAADVPLYARRGISKNNPAGGQDLQAIIGQESSGAKSRFTVGVAKDYGDITEKFVVQSDGKSAVGSGLPADMKDHTLLVSSEGATSAAIVSASGQTGRLILTTAPALEPGGILGYNHDTKKLSVGSGNDPLRYTTVTQTGKVGVQTQTPELLSSTANDLVIASEGASGMTILAEPTFTGGIHFADATSGTRRYAGSIVYDFGDDSLSFGTNSNPNVTIDSTGDVGIGTSSPSARLEIASNSDSRNLAFNADSIQARNGGSASEFRLQPSGGGVLINAGLSAASHVSVTGNGRVGIGAAAPASPLHVRGDSHLRLEVLSGSGFYPSIDFTQDGGVRSQVHWNPIDTKTYLTNKTSTALTLDGSNVGVGFSSPETTLHVRGSKNADADFMNSHVAIIENASTGSSADVLALNIGASSAGASNNYITFFADGAPIGRIERTSIVATNPATAGNFLRLVSGGADFAEYLPRRADVEPIGAGRLVGVHAGELSFDTDGADALLVTTDRAVVVGNAPSEGQAHGWETVALVGQVPVLVEGTVAAGDFLIPSGRADGAARAVAASDMVPADMARIVGRAWESSPGTEPRLVNIAVGATASAPAALAALVDMQSQALRALKEEVAVLRARLDG